ncbi:MAG: trypsin-like serine peptidase [Trebonia sp.]
MRWMARRAQGMSRRARVAALLTIIGIVLFGTVAFIPASIGATSPPKRAAPAPSASASASATATPFGGLATVGALFTASSSQPGTHFCTASVVHSKHGNLAVTAAHCVSSVQGQQVWFVPGYVNGKAPYGIWTVTAVYTDQAWQSAQNPDDDVAFLQLADANGVPVEHVTGAERLGTDSASRALVRVIGYPNVSDQPVSCVNWAESFSATQLEFDCDGYTDGTSGGPFLAGPSALAGGRGTVIGVIGGYEQGGNTPEVSYATAFGAPVAALYRTAELGSGA